jgi:CDP-2,3-bis-(O-geranylgeranyl)-sn-glycerol synthase
MTDGDPMIEALIVAGQAFWMMFPALVTGPFAVLFGGGTPIDLGRTDKRGRRLLGDGKTWAGLGWGILGGVAVGCAMVMIRFYAGEEARAYLSDFTPEDSALGYVGLLFAMCLGSMMGDILFSWAKRRVGLERGAKAPLVDQLDFLVGTWAFMLIFYPTWTLENFTAWHAVAIMLIVPSLHAATNFIAFKIGKKKDPW